MLISLMLAMTLLYGLDVLINNLTPGLARHFDWIDALTRFFMVWLVFLGLGYGLVRGRHVSMDLGERLVSPSVLLIARRAIDSLGALFCFYAVYLGWDFAERIIASGQVSNTLNVSMGWLYAAMPLGMFLIGIRYLRYLLYPSQRIADASKPPANH